MDRFNRIHVFVTGRQRSPELVPSRCDIFFTSLTVQELHPDDVGNNLPNFECAKRIAYVVADELKTGGEISQPRLVIVADADDSILFACGAR